MAEVYVGLGSNLGDRREHLRYALDRLGEQCSIKKVSSLYESEAIDCPGGKFLNAVVLLETAAPPNALLELLLKIEKERGRTRSASTEARTLDLDLLLYGQEVIKSDDLTVPHPRIHERAFVLVPLAEVSPELTHPTLGVSLSVLATRVSGNGTASRPNPLSWDAEFASGSAASDVR